MAIDAPEAERYLEFVAHFPGDERRALYTPELAERFRADQTVLRFAARLAALGGGPGPRGEARGEADHDAVVNRLCALDLETYLPDDILTKVDIASMTHSLEARAPFCDHHVVEMGARLPAAAKLHHLEGKVWFKQAFADLLPPAILERGKRGFALPTRHWLAGKLHGFARETLLATRARERGLFRPQAVEALLDRHKAGEDHGERIWNLLILEIWFRELMDGRAAFDASLVARESEAVKPVALAAA